MFNKEGWEMFKEVTSSVQCPINPTNEPNVEYDKLEKYIKDSMDKSFKKKVISRKKCNDYLTKEETKVYRVLREYMKSGKIQRKVASEYINIIKKLNLDRVGQVRCQKVNNAISELTVEGEFAQNAFWKIKKKFPKNSCLSTIVVPVGSRFKLLYKKVSQIQICF